MCAKLGAHRLDVVVMIVHGGCFELRQARVDVPFLFLIVARFI
jgi:hypothetical protein